MGLLDFFRGKRPGANSHAARRDADAEQPPRLCFVLCGGAAPGELSQVAEVVAQVFGRGYSAEIHESKAIFVARGKDNIGLLAPMPAPIPGGEAAEYADGNILWPKGKIEAARHRSHVIVTNLGAPDQTPVQSAIVLSRLALVALKVYDGLGIYWGDACVSNSRAVFEDFCKDMSEEHLPVPVWLRLQFVRASGKEIGMYTFGMRQFGLMEIEVDRCRREPQDLLEFVSDMAHYLILRGPIIADGNTAGSSEDERILVRHLPSMIEPERRVYKFVFEG